MKRKIEKYLKSLFALSLHTFSVWALSQVAFVTAMVVVMLVGELAGGRSEAEEFLSAIIVNTVIFLGIGWFALRDYSVVELPERVRRSEWLLALLAVLCVYFLSPYQYTSSEGGAGRFIELVTVSLFSTFVHQVWAYGLVRSLTGVRSAVASIMSLRSWFSCMCGAVLAGLWALFIQGAGASPEKVLIEVVLLSLPLNFIYQRSDLVSLPLIGYLFCYGILGIGG